MAATGGFFSLLPASSSSAARVRTAYFPSRALENLAALQRFQCERAVGPDHPGRAHGRVALQHRFDVVPGEFLRVAAGQSALAVHRVRLRLVAGAPDEREQSDRIPLCGPPNAVFASAVVWAFGGISGRAPPLGAMSVRDARAFAAYVAAFRDVFQRADQVERFVAYLRGLIEPAARKNVEGIATAARVIATELDLAQALQHFVSQSPWYAGELVAAVRRHTAARRADPGAVWVVNDGAFVKKGRHSVGVLTQCTGSRRSVRWCPPSARRR